MPHDIISYIIISYRTTTITSNNNRTYFPQGFTCTSLPNLPLISPKQRESFECLQSSPAAVAGSGNRRLAVGESTVTGRRSGPRRRLLQTAETRQARNH